MVAWPRDDTPVADTTEPARRSRGHSLDQLPRPVQRQASSSTSRGRVPQARSPVVHAEVAVPAGTSLPLLPICAVARVEPSADVHPPRASVDEMVQHPLSELPKTLAGLEDAFRRLNERPVDAGAIATIVNEVRQYGEAAYRPGRKPVRNNAELMRLAEQALPRYLQALGAGDHDIAQFKQSTWQSGLWYPSASIAANVMQFVVPTFLSATENSKAAMAVAGGAAGLGWILTGLLQQPTAVLPSENAGGRYGMSVEVDKARVNYKEYLPLVAKKAKGQAQAHRHAGTKFTDATKAHSLADVAEEGLEAGVQLIGRLSQPERDALRDVVGGFLTNRKETHDAHQQLMVTDGGHKRQFKGSRRQMEPRVWRPVGQGALGLLSGVDVQALARTMTATQIDQEIRRIGRTAQLPPIVIAGLQTVWAVATQVWQHIGAAFDETNKVRYKAMLDIANADLLLRAPEVAARLARGEPIRAEDIDLDKCRSRLLGPTQWLAKRTAKHVSAAVRKAPEGSEKRAQLAADLELLKAGRFTQLSEDGMARTMLLEGANHGVLRSFFSPEGVLRHDIAEKANLAEAKVQWTQRGTQAWHMGVLGSAVSSTSSRIATTVEGGAANTPLKVLLPVLFLNVALGLVAAMTAAETQTLKNYGKEGKVRVPDPESGGTREMPVPTSRQIGRGLLSGWYMAKGKLDARAGNEQLVQALTDLSNVAQQAQLLQDAFAEHDRRAARSAASAHIEELGSEGNRGMT